MTCQTCRYKEDAPEHVLGCGVVEPLPGMPSVWPPPPVSIHGPQPATKRTFESGATRDTDDGKLDYEGFLSPEVLQAFAEYMHKHRFMQDGSVRDSDNWQKGFPKGVAEKSLCRHYMDFWLLDRQGLESYERPDGERVTKHDALMGILFNTQAIAHQRITNGFGA